MNLLAQDLYFSSPQESVEVISKLLVNEDWEKLSKYYFLENTNQETIDSLKNGSFFIRDKRPEMFHPAVPWKYKKPFPPNFKYLRHTEVESGIIIVDIGLKVDQGNDMIQQGLISFYLRKTEKGYQLLP